MSRDKIVFGVHDTRIKERLLREADLTLARVLDVCRAAETSKYKMDTMGAAHTQINAMHTQKNVSHRGKHLTCLRHTRQVAATNESQPVSIADIHTLHDSVRRMARCVRNVRAEVTPLHSRV